MSINDPDDTAHCVIQPRDYRHLLKEMDWAEDFGVNERDESAQGTGATENEIESAAADQYDIDAICTALNIYYWETNHATDLRGQQKQASKLLNDTAATIDKLLSLLNLRETNAYLSSAIFSTLDQKDLDNQIIEFDESSKELCGLLGKFSTVYNKAAERKAYSNALPEAKRGRQQDDAFDALIATLNRHINRIVQRVGNADYGSADIAGAIVEILHNVGFRNMERKSIENRLSMQGDYQNWLGTQAEKQGQRPDDL